MFRWLRRRKPQPCDTCLFCQPEEKFRGFEDDVNMMRFAKCVCPKTKYDIMYCSTQRAVLSSFASWFIGMCGPQGRWWKPKKNNFFS